MWIPLNKGKVHGKNTHLALDYEIRVFLTNYSVPTTQRLDWEDKNNQRTQQWLVITTQELSLFEKVLRKQFRKIVFALELTKKGL